MRLRTLGLIAILALGLLLAPLAAHAQQVGKVYRLGYLALSAPGPQTDPIWQAFVDRLGELGWVVGRNIAIEARYADGRTERLEALAAELIRLNVDIVVAAGTSAVLASKRATSRIPIVIAGASDPVAFGLVSSLAHPGGNVTGFSDSAGREVEGKRLQLLKEAVPHASRIAVVLDSSGRQDPGPMREAAKTLGLTLLVSLETTNPDEFRWTFTAMKGDGADAVYAPETPVNARHRDLIVALAAEHRLPGIYGSREFVNAGGLMSYGISYVELYQRTAGYVNRILRGTKPRDLPVEQPSRFELALNLKTAKTLRLRIPQTVLVRAEHVVR